MAKIIVNIVFKINIGYNKAVNKRGDLMTNEQILHTAMRQSAIDSGCSLEDFKALENKVVISSSSPNARKYLKLPFYCDLTSYGNNIVASVNTDIFEAVKEYINSNNIEHCFETPALYILNDKLKKYNMGICFMAEYFLPDINIIKPIKCGYETKLLYPQDFSELYVPQWGNALCTERKHLDMLAVGAFDGEKLIGLAGASADCESMWQIGVDVLPEYRQKGIASSVTSQLALEILNREIVPFYCAAWSNVKSVKNALKSGFKPAWVQVTAKSFDFISQMNKN